MTGYSNVEGDWGGWRWTWEIRSVNGRGLDIRLRLPDQGDGLETLIRTALQKVVSRGNVTVSLRLSSQETSAFGELDAFGLRAALTLLKRIEAAALSEDLALAPTRASDILGIRGVVETQAVETDPAALREALINSLEPAIAAFAESRQREGVALEAVLSRQVDEIEAIVRSVRAVLEARSDHMADAFRGALSRVMDTGTAVDEARVAQELALIAIKTDISEELDRLDAHVEAARELLAAQGPKGRKLDFLTQEFNREANTLCSKAQYSELTRLGLDLKHVVDQVREQVQNVE